VDLNGTQVTIKKICTSRTIVFDQFRVINGILFTEFENFGSKREDLFFEFVLNK
jgi:hypothetical protein